MGKMVKEEFFAYCNVLAHLLFSLNDDTVYDNLLVVIFYIKIHMYHIPPKAVVQIRLYCELEKEISNLP